MSLKEEDRKVLVTLELEKVKLFSIFQTSNSNSIATSVLASNLYQRLRMGRSKLRKRGSTPWAFELIAKKMNF